MNQGNLAAEKTIRIYLAVLQEAVLNLRMRIRYGESIDIQEILDLLDAVHNIPEMVCAYGGWHVEKNIDQDLAQYDARWFKADSDCLRSSLMKTLSEQLQPTSDEL
jgi:hypothetical protein